jgi:hypothetical protein
MILLCVKKIQCNELSFLFGVELPTQYSLEVGKTKAKTFYTKVKISTNESLWKQIRQSFTLPKSTPAVI